MGTYGTTEEEFKKAIEEAEKALGRKLTEEEIKELRKSNE